MTAWPMIDYEKELYEIGFRKLAVSADVSAC